MVSNPRLSKYICIVFYRCGVSFNTVLCEEKRFEMFSEAASQRHKQVQLSVVHRLQENKIKPNSSTCPGCVRDQGCVILSFDLAARVHVQKGVCA